MSQANVDYVIGHNPSVHAEKVEICPNCIENTEIQADFEERSALRSKFGLPQDKKIIVFDEADLSKLLNLKDKIEDTTYDELCFLSPFHIPDFFLIF